MTDARELDVVVFGATGFTGRLVAEYLLGHGPDGLRWAMAGRSEGKLREVRAELAQRQPPARDVPLIVGDSLSEADMRAMAARTKVVCTTVGPYAKFGEPLVAACAEAGTHYCDLTGEVQFIRRMIDGYEAAAKQSGARIVHCCGFDSIPSDLGVYMLGEAMAERGATLKEVRMYAGESRGSFSGGTVASLLNVLDEAKADPSLRKVIGHPYALNPPGEREGPDRGDQTTIRFDADLGMWTAPFVMAAINTRVVRRGHALRGYPYGRDFRYSEVMSTGKGAAGWLRAATLTAGLGGFMAAASVDPLRHLLADRVLPKPGEGPSEEAREAGYFVIRHLATGTKPDGTKIELRGRVEGKKDPGYGETAKMLGESALCLAFDGDRLPVGGGSWTPASAMGGSLLERLRAAGMIFEVKEA